MKSGISRIQFAKRSNEPRDVFKNTPTKRTSKNEIRPVSQVVRRQSAKLLYMSAILIPASFLIARVAKLAHAQHLKCCEATHVGSSPTPGTIQKTAPR